MSVRQCIREVDSREFVERLASDSIEGPSGKVRDDLHAAQVTQAILNVNRGAKQRAIRLDQCVLRFEATQTQEEKMRLSMERWRAFKASHNARIKRAATRNRP